MVDTEIIDGIKKSDDAAFEVLYHKHKEYCLRFMDRMYPDHEENQDIYSDALILFIEKIREDRLHLTGASIQTYLNSVCRNQVLIRLKNKNKSQTLGEGEEDDFENKFTDWFDHQAELKTERIGVIMEELEKMEKTGRVCYELLGKRFLEKKPIEEIVRLMGYATTDSAKAQVYQCKELLKKRVFERMQ